MKGARVRLAVAAVLFLGWIGWLAYLVIRSRGEVILSRPQFLVADEWIIADIAAQDDGRPARTVTVREVVWSSKEKKAAGNRLEIMDLSGIPLESGWEGPGSYILPLTIHAGATITVTRLPPSPGFTDRGEKRIYLATPDARVQLHGLLKEWKKP